MNLLIVSQYFHPERFVISALAEDLAKRDHAVTVLTGMPNYPGGRIYEGYGKWRPRREWHQGIEIVRVPIVPRGKGSAIRLFVNYLSYATGATALGPYLLRKKRFDAILVFQLSPVTVGIPAIVMKAIKRAPVFFWIQDLWPESLEATGAMRSPFVLGLVRRLVRLLYRHADVILVQSRAFAAKVREVRPDADVRYLPNPADRLFVPVVPAAEAPERTLLRPGFRIMYAGNMGAAQDFTTVLAAAELLKHRPEIQWVLIGDGRVRSWVEEEIRRRRVESVVQVLGPFPPARMPTFFALADVMLATLRDEEIFSMTVPQKIQSYLACGRPVLVAIAGEAARIIEEAGAGVTCAAGDAGKLAEAAARLSDMPLAEREAMGRAGRRYFEREFDRDVLVSRLDEWLQETPSERSRRSA